MNDDRDESRSAQTTTKTKVLITMMIDITVMIAIWTLMVWIASKVPISTG